MLSGATLRAAAMVGTAVFRIVVSSDSMKNATAISHGRSRLLESASAGGEAGVSIGLGVLGFVGLGCIGLCNDRWSVAFALYRLSPIRIRSSLPYDPISYGKFLRRSLSILNLAQPHDANASDWRLRCAEGAAASQGRGINGH